MPTAIVCAYSPVGSAALEGLLQTGVKVIALYTYPQGADEQWFEAPAAVAQRHGIPVRMVPDFNADEVYEDIAAAKPDLLFSFYFREMIKARVLEVPRLGAFNLHGSLLPKYRGRAPINWVLVHGEEETGITLHAMTPKPDDGDIIGQTQIPISWDETALSLTLKSAQAGRQLVESLAPALADGQAPRLNQRELGASTYFGGRRPSDSELLFSMSAKNAFDGIRAVADPWPNAFLATGTGPLHLPWALPTTAPCPEGHFTRDNDGCIILGFRTGALRLVCLRKGEMRSLMPTQHEAWLLEAGIPRA